MTDSTKKDSRGWARVAFLARRDAFEILLNEGHTRRAIYDEHKADLGFSYQQFVKYVTRYIAGQTDHDSDQEEAGSGTAAPSPAGRESIPALPAQAAPAAQPQPKPGGKANSQPATGYVHNANAGNDRDDLI